MDASYIFLSFLLLIQMALILTMLNPVYDVRKITSCINNLTKGYRRLYVMLISIYFFSVIYFGMYIPLQNVHKLIFYDYVKEYDKMILLHNVEKNYITAGFSLFLVVVMCGVRSLISYTANLSSMMAKRSAPLIVQTRSTGFHSSENLPLSFLRVKRSMSYEIVLFTNELREQLKNIMKSFEYLPQDTPVLSTVLEASSKI